MPDIANALRTLAAQSLAVLARVRAALPKFTIVYETAEDDDRISAERRLRDGGDFAAGVATGASSSSAGNAVYRSQHRN